MVRRYKLQERAATQAKTRDRIVRATVKLHEELGPKATTISAIAKEAGVQRLTVYRHFPDDAALFAACSSRWFAENPRPDPAAWAGISAPRERAHAALLALYRYFRESCGMFSSVYRDDPLLTHIGSPLDPFRAYLAEIAEDLVSRFAAKAETRHRLRATLRHAVRFETWSSLAESGLADAAIADLAIAWVDGARRAR
jgi:AcrR family transcriptional regulator